MEGKDLAYWLADKIPAFGDYAKEAADVLRKQADEIDALRSGEFICKKCGLRTDADNFFKEVPF